MNLSYKVVGASDSMMQAQVYGLGVATKDRHALPTFIPYALPEQVAEWARDPAVEYIAIFDDNTLVGALAFLVEDGSILDDPMQDSMEILEFMLRHVMDRSGKITRGRGYHRVDVA